MELKFPALESESEVTATLRVRASLLGLGISVLVSRSAAAVFYGREMERGTKELSCNN